MTDIFDARIICKRCQKEMVPVVLNKSGVEVRAVKCLECEDKIIHPADLNCLEQFKSLKGKTFSVKLRIVGNSHAISIPKEIIDFLSVTNRRFEKDMDEMVRLCFEDFSKISLNFNGIENREHFKMRKLDKFSGERQ